MKRAEKVARRSAMLVQAQASSVPKVAVQAAGSVATELGAVLETVNDTLEAFDQRITDLEDLP